MKKIHFIFLSLFFVFRGIDAQTPGELKRMLPRLPGWEIAATPEVFDSENLFDRINGAAPLFIENNFREMTSMEYTKGDNYITIQAYRHATPEDAFGMYTSERSPSNTILSIGGEGHGDDSNVYFFAGDIYVKMWSGGPDNNKEVLYEVARKFANTIDPSAGYPVIFSVFPEKDRVNNSFSYITSSYIGHEFLKNVYIARYKSGNREYQLFVIDGRSTENAAEVLRKYVAFTKQTEDLQQGMLVIKDRYNGNIPVEWDGQYIVGIFTEDGEDVENADEIIRQIVENLKLLR